jgi:flagella basal body P-ring formation protein FlgA
MCLAKQPADEFQECPMTATKAVRNAAPRLALVGILTLIAGALTLTAVAQLPAWQSPESIRVAARTVVLKSIGEGSAATVETNAVDERLKLPACSAPLDAQLQSALVKGQGTVAVSCPGAGPWRLFVPVRVVEQVSVVVARRNLRAGEVLTADDLEARTQASTSLPYDYLSDLAHAVGLTVRRTVPAGTVLVPAALDYPELVERGALVTLVAGNGAVRVRSQGVAMGAARLNQRVRVRSQSGRIVEGVVQASGEVRVGT